MKERRQYVRVRSPFCVLYSSADCAREIPGVAKDISVDGAKIVLDTSIDIYPGSVVSLSILLPETALNIAGKVVWERSVASKRELGIYFENISLQCRQNLHHYIFKHIHHEEGVVHHA